jgi:D-alanyl-D-alanine carboxypeptidase/D-alanyl-D-alanine-endopeptidase (penicillin-binding protein 4)
VRAFSALAAAWLALLVLPSTAQPWDAAGRGLLQTRLETTFAAPIFADAGIEVLDASGQPLFERNARTPLTPASTLKVLTASAALNRLGPEFRAATRFSALAPPAGGRVAGPLWLIGGGDPYLTRDDLRNGVAVLARSGVRSVAGPLLVDDSLFAGPEINPHWDPGDVDGGFAAPLSAVALDQGTVEVHVTGTADGAPARVSFVPLSHPFAITQAPLTRFNASGAIDFVPDGDPKLHGFAITGAVSPGVTGRLWLPVRDLGRYAGAVAAAMLAQTGIALQANVSRALAPLVSVTLWEHRSPPLARMLKETLTHSNNHAADTIVRLLGASGGIPGTDDGGVEAVLAELGKLGVDTSGLRLYDGSGLSPADRVTALALAQTVRAELLSPAGPAFLNALPLVGKEGTVKNREVQDALGRARAKTGHLQGVDALAGTVLTRHHGRVSFAFIKNGPDAWAGTVETAQDDAIEALADF